MQSGIVKSTINPLNYYAEVRQSTVKGLGLFAKENIPQGTLWWCAQPCEVMLINRLQYKTISTSAQSPMIKEMITTILTYAYYTKKFDALVLNLDNARFINHSFTPNTKPTDDNDPFCSIALRDIRKGEEIFEDYTQSDLCPWAVLYKHDLDFYNLLQTAYMENYHQT